MTEKNPADKPQAVAKHRSASEKVEQAPDEALADPFPAYDEMPMDKLRALAKSRKVSINADVEKAELVHALREKDPSLAYDLMGLDELRAKASEMDVALSVGFERAHLCTELRAADTHTN